MSGRSNTPSRRPVVVGGTYRHFRQWCQENKVAERDAIHVGVEIERLLGLEIKQEDIVRLGYGSPGFEEVLRTRIRP